MRNSSVQIGLHFKQMKATERRPLAVSRWSGLEFSSEKSCRSSTRVRIAPLKIDGLAPWSLCALPNTAQTEDTDFEVAPRFFGSCGL
jgi:hypothetical protein